MHVKNSPQQQDARKFWRHAADNALPVQYFLNQYLQAAQTYTLDEHETMQAELDTLLADLGYGTDLDGLAAAHDAASGSDFGFWLGSYVLFDDEGSAYRLLVRHDGATLRLPPGKVDVGAANDVAGVNALVELQTDRMADRVFEFKGGNHVFSLRLVPSFNEAALKANKGDFQPLAKRTQPRCEGRVTITAADGAPRTLGVTGKRGSFTPEGVCAAEDGDPAATWLGRYYLVDTTDLDALRAEPDVLEVVSGTGGITWRWGSRRADNARFRNNLLLSVVAGADGTQVALAFEMATPGERRVYLAVTEGSTTRNLAGYWMAPPADEARAVAARATILAVTPGVSLADGALAIDIDKVPDGAVVTLPAGVPGNRYGVALKLTDGASSRSGAFAWSVTQAAIGVTIQASDADPADASLTGAFAASNAGNVDTKLTLTHGSLIRQVTLRVPVQVVAPITITPVSLPPVVRGVPYKVEFAANGGMGPCQWSVDAANLPTGLAFDPGTLTLAGTVNDAGASQGVYSLKVTAAADAATVQMAPCSISLAFSVAEPAMVGRSGADIWVIVAGVITCVLALATAIKAAWEWRKNSRKYAGDPSMKEGYTMSNNLASSMKTSLDGMGFKQYTLHIENALRYEMDFPERRIEFKNRTDTALAHYDRLIFEANKELRKAKEKLVEAQRGGDADEIRGAQADLDAARLEQERRLNRLDAEVCEQREAAEDEKERRDQRPNEHEMHQRNRRAHAHA